MCHLYHGKLLVITRGYTNNPHFLDDFPRKTYILVGEFPASHGNDYWRFSDSSNMSELLENYRKSPRSPLSAARNIGNIYIT